VVTALAAPLADRARDEIELRAQRRRDVPEQVGGASEGGRLPLVGESNDPVALGVHPAAALPGGDRVPPFVRRDAGTELREALAGPGFVLVVGESTAGKSRAAYEAMRDQLSDHVIAWPSSGEVLAESAPVIAEVARCVVWLDDLDRYLGAVGLSTELLTRLFGDGSRVVVLATMSTYQRARYDPARESGLDDSSRHVWKRGRAVIEQAREIRLDRKWSAAELKRAKRFSDDPRIAQALRGADRFGVAEILAAGPELLSRFRDGWTPGQHPRGAALVSAAVDVRRAGLHRPVPLSLLVATHETYLTDHGGTDLRPESVEAGVSFATSVVYGTTSLLLPEKEDRYLAHDYLVDAPSSKQVPDQVWEALLHHITPAEAYNVGLAAYGFRRFDWARKAFSRAQDDVRDAAHMLSLTSGTAGRPNQAAELVRTVLAENIRTLGPDHPDTLSARHELIRWIGEAGNPAAAMAGFRDLLADRTRVLGPDHPDTLRARYNLAQWTGETGDALGAIDRFRDLFADRLRLFGPDHPTTLAARHNVAYWTGKAGDATAAVTALRALLADSLRALGPDHPDTLSARHNLARWTGEEGHANAAVEALRELLRDRVRALGADDPATLSARHELAFWTGMAGDPATAVAELRDLLADSIRVLGTDHPDTLRTRHVRARWLGEGGDAAAAASDFRELLADSIDVLGMDHPDTVATRKALSHWASRGP